MKIESQEISLPLLKEKDIRLFVKRLDKVDPFISGNKWFKLKYNLIEAEQQGINAFNLWRSLLLIILRQLPLQQKKKG